MARAAGIHLILRLRASVRYSHGDNKVEHTIEIALVASSQTPGLFYTSGAEHLLEKGDMLFHPVGLPKPIRVQGAYIGRRSVKPG